MKKIKKLFPLLILAFAAACTGGSNGGGVLCEAGKATATVVAVGIGTELSCSNVPAITATLQAKLQSTNICQAASSSSSAPGFTQKSVVGNIICPTVINSVFAGGLAQLPAEWGCTGGGNVETIKAKLIASCEKSL